MPDKKRNITSGEPVVTLRPNFGKDRKTKNPLVEFRYNPLIDKFVIKSGSMWTMEQLVKELLLGKWT